MQEPVIHKSCVNSVIRPLLPRLHLIAVAALLTIGSVTKADAEEPEDASRPNVLFIMVDDLRPLLGAYGVDYVYTPNIDQLAADGIVFRRAYAQWPSCAPSRASILSGMRPTRRENRSDTSSAPSLPRHFRDNGYRTISIGKVYNDIDDDPDAWTEAPWRVESADVNWQGYASEESQSLRVRLWREARRSNPDARLYQFNASATEDADLPDDAYRDGQIAQQAIRALRQNSEENFFIAVGFVKPHLPFAAPRRYWDLYNRDWMLISNYDSRPIFGSRIPYVFRELEAYQDMPEGLDLSRDQYRELKHGYRACVSFIDAQVGLLLDELERLELRDKTIVVLMGDHGFHLGEQNVWGKHSLWEAALHTPLIVSVPDQPSRGTTSHALVELLDVYPALSELAGLEPPEGLDGMSFAPLVDNPRLPWKSSALSQYQPFLEPYRGIMGYSLRTDQYRYTEWRSPESLVEVELYDLGVQDKEGVNVVNDPRYADVVEELSSQMPR